MYEALILAAAFAAGALLGLAFFWGLWVTVDRLRTSARPALRVVVSLVLRFGVALAVFYALARFGSWQHVIAAAVGFAVVPRLFIAYRIAPGRRRTESRP